MVFVYNYDRETFQYIGKEVADESPLEKGVYLLPKYATFDPVPEFNKKNEIIVWEEGKWVIKRKKERCSLEKVKSRALMILNDLYEKKLLNFTFKDIHFICDFNFRLSILENKEMMDVMDVFYIKSKEDVILEFSKSEFEVFWSEFVKFKTDTLIWKKEFEKNINNSITIEEIDFLLETLG